MISIVIEYAKSAFKHGANEADIYHALISPLYNDILDEYEGKYLLLGFDRSMNILEIIYNYSNEQTIKIFHAMRCRNAFFVFARTGVSMPDLTEEEYNALDEELTQTTPKVSGDGKSGFFMQRRGEIVLLDHVSAAWLRGISEASHKTPTEIIGSLVREKIAASA